MQQYYVEVAHPAIISPEVYDLVQQQFKKRKAAIGYMTGGSCFSGKIVCGECGSFYGSKVWHSTSKYRRVIWQCNHKFSNDERCNTPHLYEDDIKKAFIDAFNSIIENKSDILLGYETIILNLTDTTELEDENTKLQCECEVVFGLLRKCVEENANSVFDQADYQKRYNSLVEQYETIKEGLVGINNKRVEHTAKRQNIIEFIRTLEQSDALLTEFDEELWNATVNMVTIHSENEITFIFKDGMEKDWCI